MAVSRWDKLSHQVGGIAGFVDLYKQIKQAGKDQGSTLSHFDPVQSRINDWVKEKVTALFENHIKLSQRYLSVKNYFYSWLFPTTHAVLEKAEYVEHKASQIDHLVNRFTSQSRTKRCAQLGTITILAGFILTSITTHPVKIFMITGIYFSIISNQSAASTLLKDVQRFAHLAKNLLRQPLDARNAIKRLGKGLVETAYPEAEDREEPHAYHLASAVRLGCERTFGTKEEFKAKLEDVIENQACRPIRNFEKKQRFQFLSRITDATIKKISVVASTQLVRILLTNLSGLGLVAVFYVLSHYFIDTPFDHCEWYSPITYTWNRVFPFSWMHQFPEQCHRYLYLIYFSDLTKWTLRFYIWNRMIKVWEASRATAVDDLMRPIKDWSQNKWSNITKTFSQTAQTASNAITSIFQAIGDRFSTVNKKESIFPNEVTHLPVSYSVNVHKLRSMSLTQ